MATGTLTIDLGAIAANWRALAALASGAETGAVVKADAYGLGLGAVARTLAVAGARSFFVADAAEGATLRRVLGPGPAIYVFAGHMTGDAEALRNQALTPLLNSVEQLTRHVEALPGAPFGIQLDTGMNRLGMEAGEWSAIRDLVLREGPRLVISHLAAADEPDQPMNEAQLRTFREMTDGLLCRRSLAATGGLLLGPDFGFDLVRPGIGLYGGLPFDEARPVLGLSLPVIQLRNVEPGETVGYGATWTAEIPARIATVSGGYADGLLRRMSDRATLWAGDVPCPLVGRVSMDLLTVDVTHLPEPPEALDILGPEQGIDDLAQAADTIGYEILTALGSRYRRVYRDA